MRIAICDDSLDDATHLHKLCLENCVLADSRIDIYTSPNKLIQVCEKEAAAYDLLFLDIEMQESDGISLGKKIKMLYKDAILVFTTSYPQFAIDAYDCEAFHYILKPCKKEKVYSVIEKAASKYRFLHQYHVIKVRNQIYKLPIDDIYYVECCRKHVIYHLKDRSIETTSKLSEAYNALSEFGFYQVHQGYIVNFEKVYEFRDFSIILDDNRSVMMSIRKKKDVLLAYAKYVERFI